MHSIKSALAISLAALLLATSLATAASNRTDVGQIDNGNGPVLRIDNTGNGGIQTLPRADGPVSVPDGVTVDNGNNGPSPEFGDDVTVADGPVLTLSPYAVDCEVHPHMLDNGAPEIWFKNTGTKTIPAGSIITVTYPDGTTKYLKVKQDIKPGGSVGIVGPLLANDEGFTCKATVKVKVLGPNDPTLGH